MKIEVGASFTIPHHTERFANVKPEIRITVDVPDAADVAMVAAALQEKVDEALLLQVQSLFRCYDQCSRAVGGVE